MTPEEFKPARAKLEIDGVLYYFKPLTIGAQIDLADKFGGSEKLNEALRTQKINGMIDIAWHLLEDKSQFKTFEDFKIKILSSHGRLDTHKVMLLSMLISTVIGHAKPLQEELEKDTELKKAVPILLKMLA